MRQALTAQRYVLALGLALVLAAPMAAGVPTPARAQESVAAPVLKEAYDLHQAGRFPEAAAKFEQGLRLNPTRSQAAVGFYLLGDSYQQMGDVFKAKANFEASLQADPNSQVAAQAKDRLSALAAGGPPPGGGQAAAPPPPPPGAPPPVSAPPPGARVIGPPPGGVSGGGVSGGGLAQGPAPRPLPLPGSPPSGPPRSGPPAAAPSFDLYAPGNILKDCDFCPPVVVLPQGTFEMGSRHGDDDERPVHPVTIARPIAMGRFEITFAEYDACFAQRGCPSNLRDNGWGRGNQPAINVRWSDAQAYVRWLSAITGKRYRLPSESEWEFAARGGSTAQDVYGAGQANCDGCGSAWDNKRPAPVGRFAPNGFGLYDMLGNVWEWTEDCRNDNYRGAPNDGSPWLAGDCSRRSLRGGGWDDSPNQARAAYRNKDPVTDRDSDNGFRVVRDLP